MSSHTVIHCKNDQFALIVEDEALIALDVEDVLVSQGFTCAFAMDLAEVEALPLNNFVVAIVDLWLRDGVVGQSVIRNLRKRIPHLPIVVVTAFGFSSPEADLRGLGGPTDRLQKPVAASDLAQAVRAVIDRRRTGTPPFPHRRREDNFTAHP